TKQEGSTTVQSAPRVKQWFACRSSGSVFRTRACTPRANSLCMRLLVTMRMKRGLHFTFGLLGILRVIRVEHGDDRYRAGAIAFCPVTLDQHVLRCLPVRCFCLAVAHGLRWIAVA